MANDRLIDGICELTLEVRDLDRALAFYAGTLGLAELTRDDDRVWLAVSDDVRLGLWLPDEKEFGDEGRRHVHFAFSATPGGLDALRDRLTARGHEPRGPVEHEGGDRSLYVEDPEGNIVEFWDYLPRGEGAARGCGRWTPERRRGPVGGGALRCCRRAPPSPGRASRRRRTAGPE